MNNFDDMFKHFDTMDIQTSCGSYM